MASFLVRATQRGYYRWLRAAGEEFVVDEKFYAPSDNPSFIGGWMEKVVAPPDPAPEPVVEPAAVPAAETGAGELKGVRPPEAS